MTGLAERLRAARLLIFDFDGTVADTSPFHAAAFATVLAPYGIAVDYPRIAGRRTLDALRACISEAGRDPADLPLDALVAQKQQLVREQIARGLAPLPGVDPFLRWARARYPLALATSGSRGTVGLALETLGYAGWFDPFVCADDITHAKPHPELFLTVLARTGCAAADALVFEDSASGFAAADAAGIGWVDARANLWDELGQVA